MSGDIKTKYLQQFIEESQNNIFKEINQYSSFQSVSDNVRKDLWDLISQELTRLTNEIFEVMVPEKEEIKKEDYYTHKAGDYHLADVKQAHNNVVQEIINRRDKFLSK